MRIGMILDKPFPPDPRVENEALALIGQGHEVYLFCVHHADTIGTENFRGLQVIRYPFNNFLYKMSALAYTIPVYGWLMGSKIRHFLEENEIEAIHIHDMRIAGAVFRATRGADFKTVIDLHDNFPEVMKDYPHLKKFPGKWIISPEKWKRKEAEFLEKSDKVVSVSYELVEQLQSRLAKNPGKVVLVPNTVRREFYQQYELKEEILERFQKDFVLLYIGDTAIRRGLLTAIEALPRLRKRIMNIKLVIVGKSTEDSILKNRVKELGLLDVVSFEGWQDPSTFASYIISSSICLSPLLRSVQHDAAYANKVFQYMSLGRPVLVSDALAQRKLVEKQKAGLVHKEKDASNFAAKVIQLYEDESLRETLGAAGRRFVEKEFCWELVSENLCNIYKEMESTNHIKEILNGITINA